MPRRFRSTEQLRAPALDLAESRYSRRHGSGRVAKLEVEKSGGARRAIMDTLAGAYAEVGDFKSAVEVSRGAVDLARNQKMPPGVIYPLAKNLESFRQGKPARKQ